MFCQVGEELAIPLDTPGYPVTRDEISRFLAHTASCRECQNLKGMTAVEGGNG